MEAPAVPPAGDANPSNATPTSAGTSPFRPRLRRTTAVYTRKRAPRDTDRSSRIAKLQEDDDTELQEQVKKRVKSKSTDFTVARDDHAVDLEAFARMSMKTSSGPALREKPNALNIKSTHTNPAQKPDHLKEPPKPTLASYPNRRTATPPRSMNAALHSTPGAMRGTAFTFNLPDLNTLDVPAIPSSNTVDEMDNTIMIDNNDLASPKRPADSLDTKVSRFSASQISHGTSTANEDEELAKLMRETVAIDDAKNPADIPSASRLPNLVTHRAAGGKLSSEADGFASDEMDGNKAQSALNAQSRPKSLRKKKTSTRVIASGSLKVKKKQSCEGVSAVPVPGSQGGSVGRKRSTTSSYGRISESSNVKGNRNAPLGSFIRDVPAKADSSGSADELGL